MEGKEEGKREGKKSKDGEMGKRKYKGRGSEKCSGNISTLSSKEKKLKKKE